MKVNYEVIFLFYYLHLSVSAIQTRNFYQTISNNNIEIPSEYTKTAVRKHMLGHPLYKRQGYLLKGGIMLLQKL